MADRKRNCSHGYDVYVYIETYKIHINIYISCIPYLCNAYDNCYMIFMYISKPLIKIDAKF